MSNRHLARTLVLQSLFEWDFNNQSANIAEVLEHNRREFAPDFDDQGFSEDLLKAVVKKAKEIDGLITKYAPEWPLDQITTIDRNVLRIGIYELKFAAEIPPKVAINESIELAKTYGGESSGKFVNGVLGSIFKDMQEHGEKKEHEADLNREYSAGGVVYQLNGQLYKFALIFDAYGKWTFPKGKIIASEEKETAALREVSEEIGLKELSSHGFIGSIDIKIKDLKDQTKKPTPKTIYYYLIEAKDAVLEVPATAEVKDAKWATVEEALTMIGYENALEIFQAALTKLKINN